MPTFKLVLSDPLSGRARQLELKDPLAQRFLGLRIGDEVDGTVIKDLLELPKGVKVKVTGGSGVEGAPMHPGVPGPVKRMVLLEGPPGHWPRDPGQRRKKLVRGDTVTDSIVQINAVLVYPQGYQGPPAIPKGAKEEQREKGEGGGAGEGEKAT